jgi:hypothetical protein
MGQKGAVLSTTLTTKECADLFRQAAGNARGLTAKFGELTAKVAGNDQSGFFTPSFNSPFAGIDGVPDFAVGVYVGKWSMEHRARARLFTCTSMTPETLAACRLSRPIL